MLLNASVHYKTSEEKVACEVIQQEVLARSKVKWKTNDANCSSRVNVCLDENLDHDEKYVIEKKSDDCFVIRGKTTRALLYGAGRFLRSLILAYEQDYDKPYKPEICLKDNVTFPVTSTPKYVWRGHQIAYRPKTHSYDAVSLEQMKQEVLEHVLFGVNTIEMIPPKLDDCHQSPHFTESWTHRLAAMSEWCDYLGVRVSLWYPAFPGADWAETFSALKRFDCLFVPGGDPGGRPAAELFQIIQDHVAVAKKSFPDVEVWVSSQYGLSVSQDLNLKPWVPKERLEEFYSEIEKNKNMLTGVVYGPWTADSTEQFRKRIPTDLPIRFYPDMCHNLKSQYPAGPDWDWPFALTYSRESINPRPKFFARAFEHEMPWCTHGAGCYSEGCGDDVNKHGWSCMLWGQNDVKEIMNDYADWYFGDSNVGEIILALEENWLTPLKSGVVLKTLEAFIRLQSKMSCRIQKNWRWQMICFRVYCDAFLYQRLFGVKDFSLAWPADKGRSVPWASIADDLNQTSAYFNPSAMALYGRLEASSGILHALVGMQLDVNRYGSMHEERGGHLDLLKHLPEDDGVPKGKFRIRRLHMATTVGQDGPIVEFADTSNACVASAVHKLPSRWLSFYTCIWPSALPLEIEVDVPSGGKVVEIVYVGQDLLLEGGDYEELHRSGLPVNCYCNDILLHDYRNVEDLTKAFKFPMPPETEGTIVLKWDVKDRTQVTVRLVPIPVADVKILT